MQPASCPGRSPASGPSAIGASCAILASVHSARPNTRIACRLHGQSAAGIKSRVGSVLGKAAHLGLRG
jgi:hypothetical protein